MARKYEWQVEVKDAAGTAVTDAQVAIVAASTVEKLTFPYPGVAATHKHVADGRYDLSAPPSLVAGAWVLIVSKKGKSPVVQPLALKDVKQDFRLQISGRTAATIKFVGEIHDDKTTRVIRELFRVTLHPSQELVFISGIDYFNDQDRENVVHRVFAVSRARILRKTKKVHAGCLLSLFSCDDRSQDFLVPTAADEWMVVGRKLFGDANEQVDITEGGPKGKLKPGRNHRPVAGKDVSVTDLYKYLSSVGASEPGRVLEVGFFSHSWSGGPVLFNTYQTVDKRDSDTKDFDARRSDFDAVNLGNWPNIPEAMADGGSWWAWGCIATRHSRRRMISVNDKSPKDDAFFTVSTEQEYHGSTSIARKWKERLTRAWLKWQLDDEYRNTTYCGGVAAMMKKKKKKVSVYGAPPGVGSDHFSGQGLYWMMVNMATYAPVYQYMKREFAPELKYTDGKYDKGYVDYMPILDRAPPPKPPMRPQFYLLYIGIDTNQTQLSFQDLPIQVIDQTDVDFAEKEMTDLKGAGKKGILYVVQVKGNATQRIACYSHEDGKVYEVTVDGGGKIVVGAEIS